MIEYMRRLLRRRKALRAPGRFANPGERAEYLLRSHLTPEQLADYDATATFCALGQITKLPYRIFKTTHHNVLMNERLTLCVVAIELSRIGFNTSSMPLADHMLTHKLYIENAEEKFLRTARLDIAHANSVNWRAMGTISISHFKRIHSINN